MTKIGYVDSSVILRIVLKQSGAEEGLLSFARLITSRLTRVECLRVLNRFFLEEQLSAESYAAAQQRLKFLLKGIAIIKLVPEIMELAEAPMSTPISTLDALHLATALYYRESGGLKSGEEHTLLVITHDQQMGRGAATLGFSVLGCGR